MSLWSWLKRLFVTAEIPSPSDIVPKENINVLGSTVIIDYGKKLNIPFTEPPNILRIMDIPNSNSMDGVMDVGNNALYIEPAGKRNHKIMCDWLAKEFIRGKETGWKQGGANDCVYRVMYNDDDDPRDFSKPARFYAIHRIWRMGHDEKGRWWIFKGVNNPMRDPVVARDKNILFLSTGVIY